MAQDGAGGSGHSELRDLGAKRLPRQARVEVNDVPARAVRDPFEDVGASTVYTGEGNEGAAKIVNPANSHSEPT
jgi:hypothetical protein